MSYEPDEAIITEVVLPKDENRHELEIRQVGDVLDFYLDGEKLFGGDWSGNFQKVFKRALEIWNSSRSTK